MKYHAISMILSPDGVAVGNMGQTSVDSQTLCLRNLSMFNMWTIQFNVVQDQVFYRSITMVALVLLCSYRKCTHDLWWSIGLRLQISCVVSSWLILEWKTYVMHEDNGLPCKS